MVKAYERAEEVINSANAQAEQTVNAANEDAENIRRSALEYTAEIIDNLQSVIGRTLDVARTNYDGILNGLSYNLDVLTSNREALQQQLAAPVEIPEYEPRQSSIPAPSVDEIPAQQLQAEVPADTAEDDDVDFDDVDDYDDID